jgi:hypothetical protein
MYFQATVVAKAGPTIEKAVKEHRKAAVRS